MTTTPANGTHTDNGRPHSCSSITPFLAVHPAADAIDFYVTHFGATVIDRLDFDEVPAGSELEVIFV